LICRFSCDVQINQAAKGVTSSFDALAELLEGFEHFIERLKIYTKIPPTPALDEVVVKIMAELISMLALVTKKLRKGRPSKSVLTDTLPCSARRSQRCKEIFRAQGRRASSTKAGKTHAIRASDHCNSGSRRRPQLIAEYEGIHGR